MKKPQKLRDIEDHKKILWLVAQTTTREDLLYISQLDHGRDVDRHFESSLYFKNTLDTSELDHWYPLEVWELNRWSSPGYLDMEGHRRRAFSCIGITAYDFNRSNGAENALDVLLPLFESLVYLKLPDWQHHFLQLLEFGRNKTKNSEYLYQLQIIMFLTQISNETNFEKLQAVYNQLIIDDEIMQKGVWGLYSHRTWDENLAPKTQAPFQFFQPSLTHGTAHMFAAKLVYYKANLIDNNALSKGFKDIAFYIAKFGHDDLDDFLPITLPNLYKAN